MKGFYNVYLDPDDRAKLEGIASTLKLPQAEIVRLLLRHYSHELERFKRENNIQSGYVYLSARGWESPLVK